MASAGRPRGFSSDPPTGSGLARGSLQPWYETPGSPDLPFTLNRGMSFPGVFKFWVLYVVVCLPYVFY